MSIYDYLYAMITAGIFQTVEFYVFLSVIAAAIVAASAMPARKGAVRTFLYAGILGRKPQVQEHAEPEITVSCNSDGSVTFLRTGLEGVTESGAYSIAVKISGFDVTVEERLTPGYSGDPAAVSATAVADCFGQERYHILYRSESTGRNAALSLNMRPGNSLSRKLM